jgi:hypothetical protein
MMRLITILTLAMLLGACAKDDSGSSGNSQQSIHSSLYGRWTPFNFQGGHIITLSDGHVRTEADYYTSGSVVGTSTTDCSLEVYGDGQSGTIFFTNCLSTTPTGQTNPNGSIIYDYTLEFKRLKLCNHLDPAQTCTYYDPVP